MVTLTCASWGSVENIISGVWKGSLDFVLVVQLGSGASQRSGLDAS